MDDFMLQNILKEYGSFEDNPINSLESETENNYKKILTFLKNFANFLNLYRGQEQDFVMAKDLAKMSIVPGTGEASNSFILFDFKKVFQELRSALPENVDISHCLLELFSTCLNYIMNLIHIQPENVTEIYDHFEIMRSCIQIFSETSIILDTKGFKHTVSFFIEDLMKVLTGSEFSISKSILLSVCNLISKILSNLGKITTYRELILRQILKRVKTAMSYNHVNEKFDGYVASQTFVFEYFLLIIRKLLNDCYDMGANVVDSLLFEMKEALEEVKKCLGDKLPFVAINLLEKILVVL